MNAKLTIIIAVMIIILIVGAYFIATKPAENASMKDKIKIGVVAPLTGDVAIYGEYAMEGVELALSEIGTVNDKEIELIWEDDQVDPKLSATASEKLSGVDKVDAVIYFSGSGATLAGLPVLERSKTPTVVAVASNPSIKDSGDYIFRVAPSDAFQGRQWSELVGILGYTKPVFLSVNNAWGLGIKEAFLENYGIDIQTEIMEESATDVRSQLLKIKEYNPDVLLLTCYIKDCITTVKQMTELNIYMPIIAGDVFYNQEILDAAGDATEGILVTAPSEGSGPEWQSFRENFIKMYGKEPNQNHAMAYDAVYVLCHAMQNSGTDKEKLKAELYKTDFTGASGKNKFDELGEVSKAFSLYVVSNGSFVPYES